MGTIHIDEFVTLDGVAQAPGGPQEDTAGGFTFGGWQAPLFDEALGEMVGAGMETLDALLLGRKTYDIFAGYWPHQPTDGVDGEVAQLFNRLPKYVASRGTPRLDWANTTLLGADLATEVDALRERHEHIHVMGSLDLVQTLLAERLFDELTLWVFPIVLGPGKRVFGDGVVPSNLALAEPAVSTPGGAVQLRYTLSEGTPATGTVTGEPA